MDNKRKIYCVFDKKSGTYDNPFTARTHGEAERMFTGAVNDRQSMIGQYAEDFSLWHIGVFDPLTGQIESRQHQSLGEAVAFKQPSAQNQMNA